MAEQMIHSEPAIMMGKPVIQGTRITVELILDKLAAGETFEQVLDAHPRLTKEAIQTALHFAAQALRADVVYPFERKAAQFQCRITGHGSYSGTGIRFKIPPTRMAWRAILLT